MPFCRRKREYPPENPSCWSMILSPPAQRRLPPSRFCGRWAQAVFTSSLRHLHRGNNKKDRLRGLFCLVQHLTAIGPAVIIGDFGLQLDTAASGLPYRASPPAYSSKYRLPPTPFPYTAIFCSLICLAVLIQEYTTADRLSSLSPSPLLINASARLPLADVILPQLERYATALPSTPRTFEQRIAAPGRTQRQPEYCASHRSVPVSVK